MLLLVAVVAQAWIPVPDRILVIVLVTLSLTLAAMLYSYCMVTLYSAYLTYSETVEFSPLVEQSLASADPRHAAVAFRLHYHYYYYYDYYYYYCYYC